MKITVFTGNQVRHIALINALAQVAEQVYVVQECKTIFPGIVDDITPKSSIMETYFGYVQEAEKKVFGKLCFLGDKIKTLAIKNGDLCHLTVNDISEIKNSDYYIVFGASYIKGSLFDFLLEHHAINIHIGVSPYYRGSACNFWALYDRKPEYVGATVHLLDRRMDGGNILFHALPKADEYDAFELGMRAVEAAIYALQKKVREGMVYGGVKQNMSLELRESKRREFDDTIAEKYLCNMMKPEEISDHLIRRDLSQFINPWVME